MAAKRMGAKPQRRPAVKATNKPVASKPTTAKPAKDGDPKKQAAGKARWAGVPKKERKAVVSKAAHARWKKKREDVQIAECTANIALAGFEMTCAVLKDGRRVLSERSLSTAIGHSRHPDDYERRLNEIGAGSNPLPVFISSTIRQFLPEHVIEKLSKPIRYQLKEGWGIPAFGVEATLLADICEAFLAAREAGALKAEDLPKAAAADKLMRALARVAIVALIDEATGYQVIRDRDELQRLLEKYVSEEHRPWGQVFPDEYYVELFRLRKITTEDVRKRPQYFGHLTNNIVYSRLVPGMLPRLKELNPTNENGNRTRRHTQHLTNSPGEAHLRSHLAGVVMLMKASATYEDFIKALDKAAPKVVEMPETPDPTPKPSSAT